MPVGFSLSPLAPHIQQGSGDNWLASLPYLPKAVKVFSTSEARLLKSRFGAQLKTVVRRYVENQSAYLVQGEAGGERWVNEIPDLSGVDILEGTNEATGFDDETSMRQNDAFHRGFIRACEARGVRGAILNIAVGNPREDMVRFLAPCVQAAGLGGHYTAYHGYGPAIIRDIRGEQTGTARYHGYSVEQVQAADEFLVSRGPLKLEPLLRAAGVTAPIRWLYTESMMDGCNTPIVNGAYRALLGRLLPDGTRIDIAHIVRQHELYAKRLTEIGVSLAFLFTFWGTPEWFEFEYTTVSEMMEWYKNHLAAFVLPNPPPPPPPPPSPSPMLYVRRDATPYVNIRSDTRIAPETDMGDLYPGTPIEKLSESSDWVYGRVKFQTSTPPPWKAEFKGFVLKQYLTTTPGG